MLFNAVLCSKILRPFAGKNPADDFLLPFQRYFSRTRHTWKLFENHKNKLTITINWLLVTSGSEWRSIHFKSKGCRPNQGTKAGPVDQLKCLTTST